VIKQKRCKVDTSSMQPSADPRHQRQIVSVAVACATLFVCPRLPQVIEYAHGSSFVNGAGAGRAMVVLSIVQLLAVFVGLSLPGVLLARDGIRRWWWLPAAAFLLLPDLHGELEPRLIMGSEGSRMGSEWLVAALDLALLLLPGALIALRTPRGSSPLPMGTKAGAVVIVAIGIGLWATNVAIAGKDPSDLGALVAIVAFSALWDVRTIGRAGVFVGIAAVMTGTVTLMLTMFFDPFAGPSLQGFETHLLEESLAVPAMMSLAIAPIARVLAWTRDRRHARRSPLAASA
jgi:hypothetical protein